MVFGHRNKQSLSTIGNDTEKREGCGRRMHTKKQRERRKKEGRDTVRRGRKDKEEEKIRGRSEQKRKCEKG